MRYSDSWVAGRGESLPTQSCPVPQGRSDTTHKTPLTPAPDRRAESRPGGSGRREQFVGHLGFARVGPTQVGHRQVDPVQVGIPQVDPGQVGPVQVGSVK